MTYSLTLFVVELTFTIKEQLLNMRLIRSVILRLPFNQILVEG